jgi:CheY-like chemotaxis protein
MPRSDPPGRTVPLPVAEAERPLAPGRLILVVEDDDVLRRSVTRMLEHLGQRVVAVADGVEAVEVFRRRGSQIDLVLLDVSMPRQSGAQTFAALRKLAPGVKVLLSSGYHEDHVEPALRAGAQGFLPKPYTLAQLLAALRAIH